MYLRLVQARFKGDSLSDIRRAYEEIIIPRLEKTAGCLSVCLLKGEGDEDEGISMTLWDSQSHAESYERRGVYQELLGEVFPLDGFDEAMSLLKREHPERDAIRVTIRHG